MKVGWSQRFFAFVCSIGFVGPIATCHSQNSPSDWGISGSERVPAEVMTGVVDHPFKANVKATWSHVLSDGQVFTREVTGFVSRDRLGDIREEGSLTQNGSRPDVNPAIDLIFTIENMTEMHWSSGSATVLSIHLGQYPRSFFENLAAPKTFNLFRFDLYNCRAQGVDCSTVKLGTKLIEGVRTEGTRFVETFPTDALGAKEPIVIRRDVWIDPALNVVVMIQGTDPVSGNFTLQISNVSRGPQDESLFQIPQGYKEKDITPPSGRLPNIFAR